MARILIAGFLAFGLAIGFGFWYVEFTCGGQCQHHTARGKRCQDRCFKKGDCPNAN